jgi:hypothetical protein
MQINKQEKNKQANKQASKQTNKQTNKHTNTNTAPFPTISNNDVVLAVASGTLIPSFPSFVSPVFISFFARLFSFRALERPDFVTIGEFLTNIKFISL